MNGSHLGRFLTALLMTLVPSLVPPWAVGRALAATSADRPAWRQALAITEEAMLPGSEIGDAIFEVSRFSDRRELATLVEQVRQAWAADGSRIMQSRRDEWVTLTRAIGSGVETVEIRTSGLRSEGRIVSVAARSGSYRDPSGDWLRAALADAEEPQRPVTHRDAGRTLTTRVAWTEATAEFAIRALTRELNRHGFRAAALPPIASQPADRHLPAAGASRALLMTRRGEEVAITVSEHGSRRAVVLHWGRGQ